MNINDIEVRIGTSLGELERGMEQAAQSVENGAQRMDNSVKEVGNSMAGVAQLVRSRMAMVAGIAAAAFASIGLKSAAEDAAKFTESSMDLGRAMGVSASQASVWSGVLDDIGASQADLQAASRGLTTNLRQNEDGLNAMGLATRDANGNLRPMNDLMLDAIGIVNAHTEGTDRNVAAQEIFGRAVQGNSKLLLASRDAVDAMKAKMKELGIVVGEEDVEAWQRYDDAADNTNLTMKAVQMTIGQAVLPAITDLKEAFVSFGPDLVAATRTVMETFLGILDMIRMVKQSFASAFHDIGAISAATAQIMVGNFTAAVEIMKNRAVELERETKRIKELWNGVGDDSYLGKYRARQTGQESKTPENKQAGAPVTSAIARLKDYETDQIKEAFEAQKKLYRDAVNAIDKIEKDRISMAERNKKRLIDLLTPEAKKLDLKADDPGERAANQSEARTNLLSMISQAKTALANKEFDKAIEIGEKAAALIAELKDAGAQATSVLAGQLRDVAAIQDEASAGQAQVGKAKADEAKTKLDAIKAEMDSLSKIQIGVDMVAVEKSLLESNKRMQAILDAHPLKQAISLAGAAAMAASGAAGASVTIPSAAGGWDIPAGVNPITQLHQREMVLTADIADRVRAMASGGSQPGAQADYGRLQLDLGGGESVEVLAKRAVADALYTAALQRGRRGIRRSS